jgi:hypothetical protein
VIKAEMQKFPLIGIPALRVPTDPEKARLRSAVALVMTEGAAVLRANNGVATR